MSSAAPQPVDMDRLSPADRYFNRELSWLSFNERVLAEARNTAYPLLERLRFLSISGSNLDEFMMIRVSGLAGQVRSGVGRVSIDGKTPSQQLAAINRKVRELELAQQEALSELRPLLSAQGIHVGEYDRIDAEADAWLRQYFLDHILPGSLFLGSGLLIAAAAGLCGKSWYVEHAVRRLAKARRIHQDWQPREAYLARARGVSLPAAIFGVLIQIVTAMVVVMGLLPPNRF